MSSHRSPSEVRASLKHPIIDGDGHWVEYNPVFAERMRKLAGDKAADGFIQSQRRIPDALKLSIAERKQRGIAMEGYWTRQSTANAGRAGGATRGAGGRASGEARAGGQDPAGV